MQVDPRQRPLMLAAEASRGLAPQIGAAEVRSLRDYWACSVEEAARRCGVTSSTWARWEKGHATPAPVNAGWLAELRRRYGLDLP